MESKNIFSEAGIIITIILILIPLITASIIVITKAYAAINHYLKKKELEKFNEDLKNLTPDEVLKLEQRKRELDFTLSNNELSGDAMPIDSKGLIDNVSDADTLRFIEQKKKVNPAPILSLN